MTGNVVKTDRVARFAALVADEAGTVDAVCQLVLDEWSLEDICAAWDVPYGRLQAWLVADAGRREAYEGAQGMLADRHAAETVRIADREGGGNHQHAALRIRARQWLAGKYARGRFGDAVVVEHTGETVVRLSFGGRTVPAEDVRVVEPDDGP